MADQVSDQTPESSSGQSWLDKLLGAATNVADSTAKVLAANEAADAARDNARAAASARTTTTTQPNWLLIGGIGAAVLLLIGLVAFRKN